MTSEDTRQCLVTSEVTWQCPIENIPYQVMAKTAQDIKTAMPSPNEVEDKGTLANVSAANGFNSWFSNKKPKIVKCGFYEKHHQHFQAWQTPQMLNMFDNYVKHMEIDLTKLRRRDDVVQLVLDMLYHYGCLWYWDPEYEDPMKDRDCDLFRMARDSTIRLILDLCFSSYFANKLNLNRVG